MPSIDILYLPLTQPQKSLLALTLSKDFVRALSCNGEDVHIRFHEVRAQDYFAGGKALTPSSPLRDSFDRNGQTPSPARFEMRVAWYPKTADTRLQVQAAAIKTVSDCLKIPQDNVEIGFYDIHDQNYAIGNTQLPAADGSFKKTGAETASLSPRVL